MVRELIFHLGDHKTGSTAIQDALRRGIWKGGVPLAFPARGLHHNGLARVLRPATPAAQRAAAFKALAEDIAKAEADIAVVSGENFEAVDAAALKAALGLYLPEYAQTARLIAYVRPHAERVISSWAEQVKIGGVSGDQEAFLRSVQGNGRFLYAPRFRRWREVFGARFELRAMIRTELCRNCVVRDFLSFAMRDADFELTEAPAANESLSLEDLALLCELHAVLAETGFDGGAHKSRQAIGRNLGLALAAQPRAQGTRPAPHRALIPALQEVYAADAAALDAEFFTGAPMTRALERAGERAVDAPQSIAAEDHFTAEELRLIHVFAGLVGQMGRIAPDDWVRHFSALRLGKAPPGRSQGAARRAAPPGGGLVKRGRALAARIWHSAR